MNGDSPKGSDLMRRYPALDGKRILVAPVNFSGQAFLLADQLKNEGLDIRLRVYDTPGVRSQKFAAHEFMDFPARERDLAMLRALRGVCEEGFDLIHLYWRTFFYPTTLYRNFMGIDLPYLKSRGSRIVYRFTGNDLRFESEDLKVNPYSFYRYGYENPFDEEMQRRYVGYLKEYVDQFVVQDPELQQFMPAAKIVPRSLRLEDWPDVGIERTERPLVVHASTNHLVKGTTIIGKAVEELKDEGLKFDFKLLEKMSHDEVKAWVAKADICVDNLHQGCLCVFAMEGMAMSKPVMIYLRDDLYRPVYGEVPIENCNPDNFKEKLRGLITDFDRRAELAGQGRAYLERHHRTPVVSEQLAAVYSDVLQSEPVVPSGLGDIDYLISQWQLQFYQHASNGDGKDPIGNRFVGDTRAVDLIREVLRRLRLRLRI